MKTIKTAGTLLAGIALGTGFAFALGSAEAAPQKVEYSCGTCVAPITCLEEDSCVLDYTSGYWRARQWNGSTWVRLTMVNGQ